MLAATALLNSLALLHAFPRVAHIGQAPLRHGATGARPSVVASATSGASRPAEEEADSLLHEHKAAKARAEAEEAALAEMALRIEESELVVDDPVVPEPAPSTKYHHAAEPDVTVKPPRSAEDEGAQEPRNGAGAHKDGHLPRLQPHLQPHIRRSDVQMASGDEGVASSPVDVVAPDPAAGACDAGDTKAPGAETGRYWLRRVRDLFTRSFRRAGDPSA